MPHSDANSKQKQNSTGFHTLHYNYDFESIGATTPDDLSQK